MDETFVYISSKYQEKLKFDDVACREGTAKFADTAGEKDHHLQKVLQKHVENSRAIR